MPDSARRWSVDIFANAELGFRILGKSIRHIPFLLTAMKNKAILPTLVERELSDSDFIVSKSDLSGRVTYGNPTFFHLSGYSEEELLGTQHNIIRHPDMPRCVFKLLWSTITEKRECFAYVKNLSKDGSYYWVFANITPDLDRNGNILGYFSVRRRPKRSSVLQIEGIYRHLLQVERAAGSRDAVGAGTAELFRLISDKGGKSYEDFILGI